MNGFILRAKQVNMKFKIHGNRDKNWHLLIFCHRQSCISILFLVNKRHIWIWLISICFCTVRLNTLVKHQVTIFDSFKNNKKKYVRCEFYYADFVTRILFERTVSYYLITFFCLKNFIYMRNILTMAIINFKYGSGTYFL